MKKLFLYFAATLCIVACNTPNNIGDFADLGLPSGTMWCNKNFEFHYTRYDYSYKNYQSGAFYTYVYRFTDWEDCKTNGYYDNVKYHMDKVEKDMGDNYDEGRDDNFNYIDPFNDRIGIKKSKIRDVNLPTKEQWMELRNECEWTWTGMGYKITGPNGNSIHLPALGYDPCGEYGNTRSFGEEGDYWILSEDDEDDAWYFSFSEVREQVRAAKRCVGMAVRLVYLPRQYYY